MNFPNDNDDMTSLLERDAVVDAASTRFSVHLDDASFEPSTPHQIDYAFFKKSMSGITFDGEPNSNSLPLVEQSLTLFGENLASSAIYSNETLVSLVPSTSLSVSRVAQKRAQKTLQLVEDEDGEEVDNVEEEDEEDVEKDEEDDDDVEDDVEDDEEEEEDDEEEEEDDFDEDLDDDEAYEPSDDDETKHNEADDEENEEKEEDDEEERETATKKQKKQRQKSEKSGFFSSRVLADGVKGDGDDDANRFLDERPLNRSSSSRGARRSVRSGRARRTVSSTSTQTDALANTAQPLSPSSSDTKANTPAEIVAQALALHRMTLRYNHENVFYDAEADAESHVAAKVASAQQIQQAKALKSKLARRGRKRTVFDVPAAQHVSEATRNIAKAIPHFPLGSYYRAYHEKLGTYIGPMDHEAPLNSDESSKEKKYKRPQAFRVNTAHFNHRILNVSNQILTMLKTNFAELVLPHSNAIFDEQAAREERKKQMFFDANGERREPDDVFRLEFEQFLAAKESEMSRHLSALTARRDDLRTVLMHCEDTMYASANDLSLLRNLQSDVRSDLNKLLQRGVVASGVDASTAAELEAFGEYSIAVKTLAALNNLISDATGGPRSIVIASAELANRSTTQAASSSARAGGAGEYGGEKIGDPTHANTSSNKSTSNATAAAPPSSAADSTPIIYEEVVLSSQIALLLLRLQCKGVYTNFNMVFGGKEGRPYDVVYEQVNQDMRVRIAELIALVFDGDSAQFALHFSKWDDHVQNYAAQLSRHKFGEDNTSGIELHSCRTVRCKKHASRESLVGEILVNSASLGVAIAPEYAKKIATKRADGDAARARIFGAKIENDDEDDDHDVDRGDENNNDDDDDNNNDVALRNDRSNIRASEREEEEFVSEDDDDNDEMQTKKKQKRRTSPSKRRRTSDGSEKQLRDKQRAIQLVADNEALSRWRTAENNLIENHTLPGFLVDNTANGKNANAEEENANEENARPRRVKTSKKRKLSDRDDTDERNVVQNEKSNEKVHRETKRKDKSKEKSVKTDSETESTRFYVADCVDYTAAFVDVTPLFEYTNAF